MGVDEAFDGSDGDPFGGPDLMAALHRWAAEARVDEAARARGRAHWLARQAEEATSLASVLADLAERGRPVVLQLGNGRRHRGVIRVLGTDFVGVGTPTGADVFVALAALTTIRSGAGEAPAHSGRSMTLRLSLARAVASMAEERPRVTLSTASDGVVNGELRAVGTDVATIRVDGDTSANVYVPLAAIHDIAVARP